MKTKIWLFFLARATLLFLFMVSNDCMMAQGYDTYYTLVNNQSESYNNYISNSFNQLIGETNENPTTIRLQTDFRNSTSISAVPVGFIEPLALMNNPLERMNTSNLRTFSNSSQTFNLNQSSIQFLNQGQNRNGISSYSLSAPLGYYQFPFSNNQFASYSNYWQNFNSFSTQNNAVAFAYNFQANYFTNNFSYLNTSYQTSYDFWKLSPNDIGYYHTPPLYGNSQLDFEMNLAEMNWEYKLFTADLIRYYFTEMITTLVIPSSSYKLQDQMFKWIRDNTMQYIHNYPWN